jgi:hypothetical protein
MPGGKIEIMGWVASHTGGPKRDGREFIASKLPDDSGLQWKMLGEKHCNRDYG